MSDPSLLNANGLSYEMPPALSVATIRRKIHNYPDAVSASNGGVINFTLQTGNQLIHGPSSYMKMKLTLTGGDAIADRRMDNIAGIFRRVVVSSSSGQELCVVEDFGLFVSKYFRFNNNQNTYDRMKAFCHMDVEIGFLNPTITAIMPLWWIPIFAEDRLLPSQLMHGLRIRFELDEARTAFWSTSGPTYISAFDVESHLQLDCTTLADRFRDQIEQNSQSTGLILLHKEHHRTITNLNTDVAQYDVKKSCSKALNVMVVPRATYDLNTHLRNGLQSNPYPFISAQCQIGSVFYPTSPLIQPGTPNVDNTHEPYYYVMNEHRNFDNAVPYGTFWGNINQICSSVFYQNFKLDSDPMSGVLLNNSRSLLMDLKTHNSTERRLDTYLCHLRLLRVFRNNVVVRD